MITVGELIKMLEKHPFQSEVRFHTLHSVPNMVGFLATDIEVNRQVLLVPQAKPCWKQRSQTEERFHKTPSETEKEFRDV